MIKIINDDKNGLYEYLKSRNHLDNSPIRDKVIEILKDVRENGDSAVFKYCSMFDNTDLDTETIKVSDLEIENAYQEIDMEFIGIIREAIKNIENFHIKQVQKSWMMTKEYGSILGQIVRPLDSILIYVPGGTAAYPSSVLMNSIPAKIAGVKKIYMATPCKDGKINPYALVAAKECGVDAIYKAGGVQAIGAFAYGTDTIPKVDKIVGPGNAYVQAAKREVYGYVDIDMIAGPSEILIIADESANAEYVASDMLSQAEHDELASSILITTSEDFVHDVISKIKKQLEGLDRKDIIIKSLSQKGVAIVADDLDEAVKIANIIAPEHLEIMVKNPIELLDGIKNAGSIFLGEYSPEPLGDYFAGPNHVLPTGGTASFFSPLSVDSFIKKSSFIYYSQKGLLIDGEKIKKFAEYEGLIAHKNSISVRLEK